MPTDQAKWLLTANNRLARELQQAHDQQQAAAGRSAWLTPRILPWSAWLQAQYAGLTETGFNQRILLNPHQERYLWEQIVKRLNPELLKPQSAARTAQQAWRLLHDNLLQPDQIAQYGNEETSTFLRWQNAFRGHCDRHQFISRAELADLCLTGLQANALELNEPIELVGFDDINPQQQRLLDQLHVAITEPDGQEARLNRIELDTLDDEIRAAAHWARRQLSQTGNRRIGIVSADLHQHRARLTHILRQVISPQTLLPGAPDRVDFNLSLGQPLAEYPLISQLLTTLQLVQGKPVPLHNISVLLRSPFIGGHPYEWGKRAALDFALHTDGLPQLSLNRLLRQACAHDATDLAQRLQQIHMTQRPKQAAPHVWSGQLLQLCDTLGWPGEPKSLSSAEYQQAERLRHLISEFASLSLVKKQMSFSEAIHQLGQLCAQTTFQPESNASRLSVLGVLEAAGMQFDAIWLLGMNDRQWPPAANPNPLLPVNLQREYAMPHASSARELDYAQQLTKRLRHSTHHLIASHARHENDQPQNPSALTRDWPVTTLDILSIPTDSVLHQAARQVDRTDDLPPPTAIPPRQAPGGGSHLLSAQSACPFQAVARFRMQANSVPDVQTAPSAQLNGQIVHQLLQHVWQNIQNANQLKRLDKAALHSLIKPIAEAVLHDLGRQRPDVFQPTFMQLEAERLTGLVTDWLELEKERGQSFAIHALEERQSIELNGLPLRLQADRVDRLENGDLVVIDYKSGLTQTPDWQDERPDDLQIPLYCIQAARPAAALIGQVNGKQNRFRGIAATPDIAPGAKTLDQAGQINEWPELLNHWRAVLAKLTAEIRQGHAGIAPKDEHACTWCGMQPLCRIRTF